VQASNDSGEPSSAATEPAYSFDHSLLTAVLQRWVKDARVDYEGLRSDADLNRYLAALAEAQPDALPQEQERLAFWINAYNACVLKGVVDHYPLDSVRSVKNFFTEPRWRVAGANYSLNQIENDVIRKRFAEPRIHFALVCAASSCPPLQDRAFAGATLEETLERVGRAFLQDPTKNRLDRQAGVLYLSAIFNWYRLDFEKHAGSLQAFVRPYLSAEDAEYLAERSVLIQFLPYDWSLNKQ